MNIIEKRGFKIRVDNENDRWVIINNENIQPARSFMLDNRISQIELNYTFGFTQESTDFLEQYSFVEGIAVIPAPNININGLHFLSNLRKLRISNGVKQGIHFKLFPLLQSCSIDWNVRHKDLQSCTSLQELSIFRYKAEDITDLINLVNLEGLKVGNSSIKSLEGIESFQKLKSLSFSYNSKLSSLKGIEALSATLKELDIEACKAISSIDEIAGLVNLERLGLNNCGEIASIKPIENLKKLNRLDFWESTNIIDGDVTPCIGIKQVAFQNRKHYNYTNEEIDKINVTKSR